MKLLGTAHSWADKAHLGEVGLKEGAIIRSTGSAPGLVVCGPYTPITPGRYRVQIDIAIGKRLRPMRFKDWIRGPAKCKIVAGDQILAKRNKLHHGTSELLFTCAKEQVGSFKSALEVKIWTTGAHEVEIRNIETHRIIDDGVESKGDKCTATAS